MNLVILILFVSRICISSGKDDRKQDNQESYRNEESLIKFQEKAEMKDNLLAQKNEHHHQSLLLKNLYTRKLLSNEEMKEDYNFQENNNKKFENKFSESNNNENMKLDQKIMPNSLNEDDFILLNSSSTNHHEEEDEHDQNWDNYVYDDYDYYDSIYNNFNDIYYDFNFSNYDDDYYNNYIYIDMDDNYEDNYASYYHGYHGNNYYYYEDYNDYGNYDYYQHRDFDEINWYDYYDMNGHYAYNPYYPQPKDQDGVYDDQYIIKFCNYYLERSQSQSNANKEESASSSQSNTKTNGKDEVIIGNVDSLFQTDANLNVNSKAKIGKKSLRPPGLEVHDKIMKEHKYNSPRMKNKRKQILQKQKAEIKEMQRILQNKKEEAKKSKDKKKLVKQKNKKSKNVKNQNKKQMRQRERKFSRKKSKNQRKGKDSRKINKNKINKMKKHQRKTNRKKPSKHRKHKNSKSRKVNKNKKNKQKKEGKFKPNKQIKLKHLKNEQPDKQIHPKISKKREKNNPSNQIKIKPINEIEKEGSEIQIKRKLIARKTKNSKPEKNNLSKKEIKDKKKQKMLGTQNNIISGNGKTRRSSTKNKLSRNKRNANSKRLKIPRKGLRRQRILKKQARNKPFSSRKKINGRRAQSSYNVVYSKKYANEPVPVKTTKSCICGQYNGKSAGSQQSKIINGERTHKSYYTWMASIQLAKTNFHFCGGSIITENFVLTAAHCTYGQTKDDLLVVLGEYDLSTSEETDEEIFKIKNIIEHEKYNSDMLFFDIALIELEETIVWKSHITPICLTPPNFTFYKEKVSAMGWGVTQSNKKKPSNVIKHIWLKVLHMRQCRNSYSKQMFPVKSSMFCAQGENMDTCQGDSGGPLVWYSSEYDRYLQIGIVSWGLDCNDPDYPGVYTKLKDFLEWIYEVTEHSAYCKSFTPTYNRKKKVGNKRRKPNN